MKVRSITTHVAIGAVAAMLALPAVARDQESSERSWVFPWMPAGSNVIDMINGNDFRDNRDSTISRNDVPVDQTTLPQADAQQWRSSEATRDGDSMAVAPASGTYYDSAALPATAVDEADPEIARAAEPAPSVDDLAQQRETIVNTAPEPSLAAEHELGRDGFSSGESNVTARNLSGVETVHDATRTEVYTGQPGAGGTDDVAVGSDGVPMNAQ
jgi:hypothetical protein